ncbi:MFS transporter [Streptomyces sp. SID5914]|nr:MFS transporter [Streptomyces sp. SID5914]MZG13962.1 MFS transporter [Streptomyces sp. SID5914]
MTVHEPRLERLALSKVKRRLLPLLILALFIAYVDRVSIGVTATSMEQDIGLTASAFGFAAGLFFVGYALAEVPSNVALVRFGARRWIARIMLTWGLATVAIVFVQSAPLLYALRFLLGLAEAGLYPGILLYLTYWFPGRTRARAYSLFELGVPVSLALASVLTSLILSMDGVAGLAGWRWVFLLTGLPAVLLAFVVLRYLPDGPAEARWLGQAERACLMDRVEAETPAGHHSASVWSAVRQPSVWGFAGMYFCMVLGFWSITYWLPQIVQQRFATGPVASGLLSAIPWATAVVAILVVSKTSDRTGDRRRHILVCLGLAAIGMAMAAATSSAVLALAGLCLAGAGMQAAVPLFWSYPAARYSGPAVAVALALINSIGNIGGFVGPYLLGVFQDLFGNTRDGLYVMAGFFLLAAMSSPLLDRQHAIAPLPTRTPLPKEAR